MSTFKQLIETYGKQIDLTLYQALNRERGYQSAFHTFTSDDIRSANMHFDGALFTSVMRCLDVVFEGDLRKLIDANYVQGSYWWGYPRMAKGDEFLFRLKATANGESKTIDYGAFHIAEELEYDENADTTKVVAYDRMYEAMKPYDISSQSLTFPTTLKEYTKAVCKACFGNTIIIEGIDNIRNGSKTVTSDLYAAVSNDSGSSYTFRDVLDEIARCAGCSFAFKSNANGNYTNRLYLIYVTDGSGNMIVTKDENNNPYVLDIDNFKSLTIGEQYGTINSVIYSRQPQNDNVMKSATGVRNPVAVKLKQPEIADSDSDATRLTWLTDVLAAVNGLNYRCYELESYGIGYLNFGDTFTIKTYEQVDREFDFNTPVTYQTIFMRCDMDFAGGDIKDKSKLEMPVATAADVEDSATAETATEKMLRQAFMRVDKEIGQIKALLTDPDESLRAELTATAAAIRLEMENGLEGLENEIETTASGINARIASEVDDLETLISTTASGLSASFTNSINGLQSQISANASSISAALTAVSTVQGQIEGVTDDIDDLIERIDNIDVTDDIAAAVQTEIQKSTTISAIAGQVNSQISGTYVTKASLPTELSSYAKKSEIPTDYLTDADLPDLSGYALKSELPTMTNYVLKTEYNSYISQTDANIAAAVSRVATLEGAGYVTSTEAQTLINQSATSITATVTSNIKVGAVNLLYDSACFEKYNITSSNYYNVTPSSGFPKLVTSKTDNSAKLLPSQRFRRYQYTCSNTADLVGVFFPHNTDNKVFNRDLSEIETDTEYVFSFWAKADSNMTLSSAYLFYCFYDNNGTETFFTPTINTEKSDVLDIKTTFKQFKVYLTFPHKPVKVELSFYHAGVRNMVYGIRLSSLQLEKGNIATYWSDVDKSIDDRLNGELCTSVILNKNGLTVENGALTIKDGDGEVTISSGKVISNQIEFGTREEIATLSPSSTYFKSLTSAMKTTITGLNLGSDFQSLYDNGTGWKTWKESSVYNAQQNRIFINDYNNSFSIERNKYYTISCEYIVISKDDSKYPLIDFWVDNRYDESSDENFCEFKLFSTDVPGTVKKSNGNFDYYISYGEYSKTISGKKILTDAAVGVDSLSGLAVSARLFNIDCFNHIFDSTYNGYPLYKFYREGKILENLYYQDSGGNTHYLDTFEVDNNCIVAIKNFKITSFQGSAITAGAVMNYGDDCFIDFDEGHLKCNSARIGRVETTFESWGGRSIKSANRDVIRSDGGFVLSANNGNNAMILDFKSLSFNGLESQSTGISGSTNWRYLIYNINTGEVRSKEI